MKKENKICYLCNKEIKDRDLFMGRVVEDGKDRIEVKAPFHWACWYKLSEYLP